MKESVAIVLDSSIYKQIPKLNSQLVRELIKYCRLEKFRLFIPEVVEQEYLTWVQKEIGDALETITRASNSLARFDEPLSLLGFSIRIDSTVDIATMHFNKVLKDVVSNWEKFKSESKAVTLPIENYHGRIVMAAYFQGESPFKSVKNRTDIPDAFIYYSILDVLKSDPKVLFVSADKAFVSKIADTRIVIFEKLHDLFASTEYKLNESYFSRLESVDKWFQLFQYFKEEITRKAISQINRADLVYDIESEYWDDVVGEFRETYSDVESVSLDHSDARTISLNSYLVPFVADIQITVSSFATFEELKSIDPKRKEKIGDTEVNEEGKHDVKEVHWSRVSGNLSVQFAESDPLSWKPRLDTTSILREESIDEISVTLENIEKSTQR